MKILSTFETLATLTALGTDAGFPLANIVGLNPMVRWHSAAYAVDQWVKCDFGSAKSLTALFLNQCNFAQCRIQGHATDDWTTPSYNELVSLVQDRCSNRKGWFDLTAFNYQWLRILIPAGQTLDNAEAVPAIGNLICGTSADLPKVTNFSYPKIQDFYKFKPDGAGLRKTPKGLPSHNVTIDMVDDRAAIEAVSSTWSNAVVFFNLGNAAQSFLVYAPDSWCPAVDQWPDMRLTLSLEELT